MSGGMTDTLSMADTNSTDHTMLTVTDRCNVSESQGWQQDTDGTWTALTRTRSRDGFKSERGARNWFMRNATEATLRKMGLA